MTPKPMSSPPLSSEAIHIRLAEIRQEIGSDVLALFQEVGYTFVEDILPVVSEVHHACRQHSYRAIALQVLSEWTTLSVAELRLLCRLLSKLHQGQSRTQPSQRSAPVISFLGVGQNPLKSDAPLPAIPEPAMRVSSSR